MKRHLSVLFCLFLPLISHATPIDPHKLVKVDSENNSKCVEYYNYHGEMYCSTKALSPTPLDPNLKNYETQKIVFDDRVWMAAWGKKNNNLTIVEYVPNGDSVDNWHELVTSQFISKLNDVTPKELADAEIQHLAQERFSPIVKFYEESPTQVVYEFRILSPDNQKQDELQVIRKKDNNFYILHYVTKESDMGDKQRDAWLTNLKNSTIK